jgi:hypothetical protein
MERPHRKKGIPNNDNRQVTDRDGDQLRSAPPCIGSKPFAQVNAHLAGIPDW